MADNLTKANELVKEREGIDAEVARITSLNERRKAINVALSELMGLVMPVKRGRKPKQPNLL